MGAGRESVPPFECIDLQHARSLHSGVLLDEGARIADGIAYSEPRSTADNIHEKPTGAWPCFFFCFYCIDPSRRQARGTVVTFAIGTQKGLNEFQTGGKNQQERACPTCLAD